MGKIIKAEKRGGGIESKVIEEYTPLGIWSRLFFKTATALAPSKLKNMPDSLVMAGIKPTTSLPRVDIKLRLTAQAKAEIFIEYFTDKADIPLRATITSSQAIDIQLTDADLDKRRLSLLVEVDGVCLKYSPRLLLAPWLVCRIPRIRVLGVSPSICSSTKARNNSRNSTIFWSKRTQFLHK